MVRESSIRTGALARKTLFVPPVRPAKPSSSRAVGALAKKTPSARVQPAHPGSIDPAGAKNLAPAPTALHVPLASTRRVDAAARTTLIAARVPHAAKETSGSVAAAVATIMCARTALPALTRSSSRADALAPKMPSAPHVRSALHPSSKRLAAVSGFSTQFASIVLNVARSNTGQMVAVVLRMRSAPIVPRVAQVSICCPHAKKTQMRYAASVVCVRKESKKLGTALVKRIESVPIARNANLMSGVRVAALEQ